MSIRYTLRHNIPDELVQQENDIYAAKQEDVNDSSTFDFNLMRKHELAETQSGSVVYRRKTGEIVDWAEATNLRGEQILAQVEAKKQEVFDTVAEMQTDIADSLNHIGDSVTEATNQLDAIVQQAEEATRQVEEAREDISSLLDLDRIESSEIDTIVGRG